VAAERDWQALVISGPQCPSDRLRRLRVDAARAGIVYRTFVPTLRQHLPSVDVLVCMGGYNTLVEAAATGVPTVCVPRVAPRREQLVRARAFARRGLLRLLEPHRLGEGALDAEITAALAHGRRNGASAIDLSGAERAARQLLALAQRPVGRERPRRVGVA
jgi:predicted glycosyltransferase